MVSLSLLWCHVGGVCSLSTRSEEKSEERRGKGVHIAPEGWYSLHHLLLVRLPGTRARAHISSYSPPASSTLSSATIMSIKLWLAMWLCRLGIRRGGVRTSVRNSYRLSKRMIWLRLERTLLERSSERERTRTQRDPQRERERERERERSRLYDVVHTRSPVAARQTTDPSLVVRAANQAPVDHR